MAAAVARFHQDDLIAFSQGQPGANKLEIEFTAVGLIDKAGRAILKGAMPDIIQAEFVENAYSLRFSNFTPDIPKADTGIKGNKHHYSGQGSEHTGPLEP